MILCGSPSFFNDAETTAIYTLSLHDALPICGFLVGWAIYMDYLFSPMIAALTNGIFVSAFMPLDRKSTRLNSSHVANSYAVFCLKKKHLRIGEAAEWIGYQTRKPPRRTTCIS